MMVVKSLQDPRIKELYTAVKSLSPDLQEIVEIALADTIRINKLDRIVKVKSKSIREAIDKMD